MQKNSLIKQNILQYLDFIGITQYRFYQETGITRGILTQDNGMSEENTTKFLAYYTDVNPEWLLTGKGEMLKSKEPRTLYWRDNETGENIANKVNETPAFEINSDTIAQIRLEALHDKEKIIAMLEKDNERLEKELQDKKQTIEQLKKELSLASNRKVGVKSDG